jgi:hypothetical protein
MISVTTYFIVGFIIGMLWEVYMRVYHEDEEMGGTGILVGGGWPVAILVAVVAGFIYLLDKVVDKWATNVKHVEKAQEYKKYKV